MQAKINAKRVVTRKSQTMAIEFLLLWNYTTA